MDLVCLLSITFAHFSTELLSLISIYCRSSTGTQFLNLLSVVDDANIFSSVMLIFQIFFIMVKYII